MSWLKHSAIGCLIVRQEILGNIKPHFRIGFLEIPFIRAFGQNHCKCIVLLFYGNAKKKPTADNGNVRLKKEENAGNNQRVQLC